MNILKVIYFLVSGENISCSDAWCGGPLGREAISFGINEISRIKAVCVFSNVSES